jgi:hypothetical protein
MGRRVRVPACALVVALGLASWGIGDVAAEPSTVCRDLATEFGTAPAHLDARSLARLGTCVITEIGERAGATEPSIGPAAGPASSPPPVLVLPPLAPSEAPQSPLTRRYGDWPPPALWTAEWPTPEPWLW